MQERPPQRPALAIAAFFCAALVLLFAVAVGAPLNHDEHQFVASAVLLADDGLIPARDYPYFHTPNLVGVYAALFLATDHHFLTARLFSMFCAWLSLGLISACTWHAFQNWPPRQRLALTLGAATLLLFNPVFIYTFGRAWNQAFPALLTLLAIASQIHGAARLQKRWFFVTGLLVALAVGSRISYAPLALPFLVMAALIPSASFRERAFFAIALAVGGVIGSLPLLALFAEAPAAFVFDNFIYNSQINSAYREASGDLRSALPTKLLFFARTVIHPGNLVITVAFLAFAIWPAIRSGACRRNYPLTLVLALFPFALFGAWAPTPSYSQYFFLISFLAILGAVFGLATRDPSILQRPRFVRVAVLALLLSVGSSIFEYRHLLWVGNVAGWVPMQLHAQGLAIRDATPTGPILTVAPMVPLEGDRSIYPAFTTGAFAWRTAKHVAPADRHRFGFISPAELPNLLATQPPAAILTGFDRTREKLFLAHAKKNGFQPVPLPGGKELWLAPPATR